MKKNRIIIKITQACKLRPPSIFCHFDQDEKLAEDRVNGVIVEVKRGPKPKYPTKEDVEEALAERICLSQIGLQFSMMLLLLMELGTPRT